MNGQTITEAEVYGVLSDDPDSFLSQYVWHAATQTGSPAAYHIGVALSLLAATAPQMWVGMGFLSPTPPNLWVALIGRSGEAMKTLALNVGRGILRDAGMESAIAADPASEEAFVKQMAEQPQHLLLYDDMGQLLANTAGGINNYRARILDSQTALFDGNSFTRMRTGRLFSVVEPRLSILGGCTPVHVEFYTTPMHWEGGWLSRFMVLFANSERDVRRPTPDWERRDWLVERTAYLRDCQTAFNSAAGPAQGRQWWYDGRGTAPMGRCTGMTADADALWEAWLARIRQQSRQLPDMLAGAGSRTPLMAAKVATLLAWDRVCRTGQLGQDWQITGEDLRCAAGIALLAFRSTVELTRRVAPTEDARYLRMVLAAVGTELTSQAEVLGRTQLMKRRVEQCLVTLEEQGMIDRRTIARVTFWRRTAQQAPDEAAASDATEVVAALGGSRARRRWQSSAAVAEDPDGADNVYAFDPAPTNPYGDDDADT